TMGAVGPNHLVVTLSDRVTIQNKSGAILVTKSPDSFWSPLGTNLSPFDPRVAYDPYNNRWIMTVGSSPFSANSGILLAVSATSDPTGTWYYYRIDVDSGNLLWADQPSFGFTKDWITISANTYQINGGFNGTKIWALNKAKAYSNTGITYTSFTTTGMGGSQIPAQTYDNTLPTQYFVQEWNSHINGNGYLHVYKIEGPVDTPTFSSVGFAVAPAPWNAYTPMINGGFAPQAGTTNRIMTGDARIINVVYRNGFLWAAHTIFLPAVTPVRASAQWWQLDTSANIIQRGRVDDPTATATNGGFFYAYPSVTVNANNDVLVGYTRFSSNTYASAAFSYRRFSDPLNTLPSSQVFQPGLAIYTLGGGAVRWGDYSNSLVDPVNNIDFWTIQEYAEVNNHWGIAWGHLAAKIC
ncbi:MAG TPA: hypothetical protein VLG50_01955, partial [Candidatus Saccharimonadales bacterium]|nr:hypothetical protein [Candidatus Saccharimonadales bacterium]